MKIRYSGKQTEYLDGFPAGCQRSVVGSLHLRPGSITEITSEEYAFIKSAYSFLLKKIEVIGELQPIQSKPQETVLKIEQNETVLKVDQNETVLKVDQKVVHDEHKEAMLEPQNGSKKQSKRKSKRELKGNL